MKQIVATILSLTLSLATMAQAKLEFKDTRHDFGAIKEDGGKVTYVFGFKNTGNEDLEIDKVKTPCGCTSPKWTKSIIPPGKGGYVEATFDPLHRPGVFNKVLTVVTNAEPKNYYLTIMGDVLPRKKTIVDRFPMKKGNLRFKTPQLYFGKVKTDEIDTLHFVIYNSSKQTIEIKGVQAPKHIQANILEDKIEPQSTAKIIVRYNPLQKADLGFVSDQIVIKTTDVIEPEKVVYVVAQIERSIPVLTPEEMAKAPKIRFEETTLDLGEVKHGETAKGVFTLHNDGKRVLKLLKVKPECGCTSTSPNLQEIEAGESTNIDLAFDSNSYSGLVVKNIDVYSDDPLKPKVRLKIKAVVVNE